MTVRAPDALVLGGGALLGEAWMNAVLVGLERAGDVDLREADSFIGTSAGSIVASALAAGIRPERRLGRLAQPPSAAQVDAAGEPSQLTLRTQALFGLAGSAVAPLAALALGSRAATMAGSQLRRALLSAAPAGRRSLRQLAAAIEQLHVQWDGRLRITAVDVQSGRRVVFGPANAPQLSVAAAVQASCAIPGVFEPVRVGGRSYVDGGVWSPTNIDAADVGRGARVLCLNPTGSLRPSRRAPVAALGALSRSIAAVEGLALRRRGASVRIVNPDEACRRAMGANLFDGRRRARVIAAGLEQGQRLAQQLDDG